MSDSSSDMLAHRISIIVAVYNGAATIQALFDSLRPQKAPEIELLVVDGGSSDATMELVAQNADLVDCLVSEPDTGIYNAWNKGLALATGEWICFAGADDSFATGAIATYLNAAAHAASSTELISSRVRLHAIFSKPYVVGNAWSWPAFQRRMTIAHVGALHRRALYARLGQYDESYRICGDYEFLLRARNSLRTEFVDFVTVEMGGGGVSNNQLWLTYEENSRARSETGGRASWRVAFERRWDHFLAIAKRSVAARFGKKGRLRACVRQ